MLLLRMSCHAVLRWRLLLPDDIDSAHDAARYLIAIRARVFAISEAFFAMMLMGDIITPQECASAASLAATMPPPMPMPPLLI